ncbi:hypothetical protein TrVGV298_010566 [Trichoderma virens]|nr:hypothetical protein TrVGV298_010566 [Trichoderma virens]
MFIIYTHQNQITQSIRALVNSKSLSREELLTSSLVAKPDEEYSIKDNFQLFEAATKDPAFEWLVKKLSNELTSTDIDSFAVKQFSSCIRDRLPRFRRINRKYPSKPYKITFDVECDIPKFIQDQGYEGSAADVVPKVITLTGSIHDVQAATCEHYLIQTWPVVGCNLLRTIQGALREEHTSETFQYSCKCKFEDRTEIKVSIGRSMKVEAIGSIPSIIEIGEQIGWLATAFKSSFQDSEISFCHPEIIRFQTEDVTGSRSIGNEFEQAFKCEVHVATDHIRDNLPSINGQCWQQIFNNPVVVTGYPIKFRDFLNSGVGLELPF